MSVPRLSLTRRQFTMGLAGPALAFPGVGNSIYNPKLAGDCSIWLQEPAARKRRPAEILDEAFSAFHRAGYRRLAVPANFLAPELRNTAFARMDQYALEASIVCISGELHTRAAAEISRNTVLETARAVAGRAAFIAFTIAPKRDRKAKTADELDIQSYELNQMGQELQHTGVGLILNHELREMADDAREWRHAVTHTEARLVSLCIDVESAVRAGVNPWEFIETAGSRLRSVHLRNERYGVEQELLEVGDINMAEIAAILRQAQYDGFLVVELRYGPGTPIHHSLAEALAMNRWYMQEVFGSRPGLPPVDMGPHVRIPRSF